jgi:hypothetical protein
MSMMIPPTIYFPFFGETVFNASTMVVALRFSRHVAMIFPPMAPSSRHTCHTLSARPTKRLPPLGLTRYLLGVFVFAI